MTVGISVRRTWRHHHRRDQSGHSVFRSLQEPLSATSPVRNCLRFRHSWTSVLPPQGAVVTLRERKRRVPRFLALIMEDEDVRRRVAGALFLSLSWMVAACGLFGPSQLAKETIAEFEVIGSAFGGWPREVSTRKERKLGEVDDASTLSPLREPPPRQRQRSDNNLPAP